MSIIDKINRSRTVLKEILEKEGSWDTSSISDLSNEEISILLDTKTTQSDSKSLSDLGAGTGLFLSMPHKFFDSINLKVVFYNLSTYGKGSRVTKNIKDKIHRLYEESYFRVFDSVIIIVDEEIGDTINKSILELNNSLNNDLNSKEFPDEIIKIMDDKDYHLEKKHFRNVWIFDLTSISVNLTKNRLVPEHIIIREDNKIKEILEEANCSKMQLPIIKQEDIQARLCLSTPGDIMKIIRSSKSSGTYAFYRLVR